jgi:hypothetical protein
MNLMRITCLLFLLSAVAGCTYAPGKAEVDPLSVEAYPQITVSGVLEGNTFLAEPPVVQRGDNRPLSISVPLRLAIREEIPVQYRFIFTDQAGRPLDIEPGWTYTVMRGRERTYLAGAASDTTAADWQLQVRESK